MEELLKNPVFGIYALNASLLCLNLMFLWGYSGGVRAGTKSTPNPEDAGTVSKGATVQAENPEGVARVLRAHANAMANITPFLFLAFLYVLLGATPTMAWILFGGFTAMRWLHSLVYLAGKQPWRTITFAVGGILTGVVLIEVVRRSIPLL